MQRYVNVERVEHAKMLGVVLGTLSVDRYQEMLNRLMRVAEKNGQQAYPIMVGKAVASETGQLPRNGRICADWMRAELLHRCESESVKRL